MGRNHPQPLDAGVLVRRVRLEPPHAPCGLTLLRHAHDAASRPDRSGLQICSAKLLVELLPRVEVGLLELGVRAERQTALVDEARKPGLWS